jgi:hypothetical protein
MAGLVALATGCSTTKTTESLLTASGFKMVTATTPQQEAHLKSLPPHKVTMVVRSGQPYFTYPDVKNNVLYVGQEAQYQAYEKLAVQKQMADEQLNAAELNNEAPWGAWGAWPWR